MIDIDLIRKDKAAVVKNLARRGVPEEAVEEVLELDQEWREVSQKIEELNKIKNEANNKIAKASAEEKKEIISQIAAGNEQEKQLHEEVKSLYARRDVAWGKLPNLLADDVPRGKDESENKILREVGEKPTFSFTPLSHEVLGQKLGVIDNERAAKVSGSRFTYIKGGLALLEFALIQHVFSILTNKSALARIIQNAGLSVSDKEFIPVLPPVLIKEEVMQRMARLEPREERYHMPQDNLYLVGSAEHTIGSMHMDEILPQTDLPLRYIGFSSAFRREAGSHGKDVKGIIRMHQFDKMEIESFTLAQDSQSEQDFLVAIQEHILQTLGIPYRVMMICTGDMGDPDARQIDIEAWMPGQEQYRETHTSDLMTDYQARRLKTRVKRGDGNVELVHMNDATALALGRTMVAIMENYQQEDGSIAIPEVLQPYLPFTRIQS
jgi:seryl-tRNA synthetase